MGHACTKNVALDIIRHLLLPGPMTRKQLIYSSRRFCAMEPPSGGEIARVKFGTSVKAGATATQTGYLPNPGSLPRGLCARTTTLRAIRARNRRRKPSELDAQHTFVSAKGRLRRVASWPRLQHGPQSPDTHNCFGASIQPKVARAHCEATAFWVESSAIRALQIIRRTVSGFSTPESRKTSRPCS